MASDVAHSKVTITVLVACMLFVASGAWALAVAWTEQKNAIIRLQEKMISFDSKLDRYNANSWTFRMERDSWLYVSRFNHDIKTPDIRSIYLDNQSN